jgi:molybdopterin-biosynthesis enzyme MoeA-like protein
MKVVTNTNILQDMADRRSVMIKDLPSALVKMARTLDKSECLPNPLGWAPVTVITVDKTTIFTLPGPPREMQACYTEHLAKKISEKTELKSLAKRFLVPMYESQISQITNKIMSENPGVYLKPLVSEYKREKGLPVDIITFGKDKKACQEKIDLTIKKLKKMIPNRIKK